MKASLMGVLETRWSMLLTRNSAHRATRKVEITRRMTAEVRDIWDLGGAVSGIAGVLVWAVWLADCWVWMSVGNEWRCRMM